MPDLTIRGRLLLGDQLVPGALVIESGRIAAIERSAEQLPHPIVDAEIVSPGFIDLQVNGGFGVEVGTDPDAFRRLAAALPATGVTAYLPTAVSSPPDFYPALFAAFAASRDAPGARALGLHLEGPFLSPNRIGAHRREVIENASPDLIDTFLAGPDVRLVTLAPERPGALDWICRLVSCGILVSLGHTDATAAEFERGIDAGALMTTHLYNAMSPFGHRSPNAIGAALTDDRVTCGLIVDGIHSDSLSLRLAVRAKAPDRICLVTDMMSAAGMPPGKHSLFGKTVTVDETSARLEDGTLAGSIVTMDETVRNAVRWMGVTPAQALSMATAVPARLLDLPDAGRLVAGARADLALLDAALNITATYIAGKKVYSSLDK